MCISFNANIEIQGNSRMIAYRYTRFLLPLKMIGYCCIAIGSLASTGAAQTSSGEQFLKVINDKSSSKTVLQLLVRKFEHREKKGPVVTLHSMVHIADRSFFETQQRLAESSDVILFEGTKPPGAGALKYTLQNSDSTEARITLTKMRLGTLGFVAKKLEKRDGKIPLSFSEMQERHNGLRFLDILSKDGWGNEFQFRIEPVAEVDGGSKISSQGIKPGDRLEIISLGKDNRPGGEGEDADMMLSNQDLSLASNLFKYEAIQEKMIQVARVLGLAVQGDVMVEKSPRWRSSDLAIDQMVGRFEAEGVSLDPRSEGFASFPLGIVEPLLKVVQATPHLKNAGKMFFLEFLEESGPSHYQPSYSSGPLKVIVMDRNQVVIDDLNEIIDKEPEIKSVGIVYGAGHMPNLEVRLKEMDYQEVSVEWVDAITVQLPKNPIDKVKMELAHNLFRKTISFESKVEQLMKRGDAAGGGEASLKEFQKAQVLFEESVKKNPKDFDEKARLASCYDRIGLAYQTMGQLENAFEFFGKGEKIRRSLVDRFPKNMEGKRNLAWSLARLGDISLEMGKPKKALGHFQEGRGLYQLAADADPKNAELKQIIEWYNERMSAAKSIE
jgi:tetratricopeptide (TPR) repeat protein